MLKDPRSSALVENFAAQWLQLRTLKNIHPDKSQFPKFDDPLRAAMEAETKMFFETIVREDRNILEFLDSDLEILIKDKSIIFQPADVKSWFLMLLRGLHHCHKNFILHRVLLSLESQLTSGSQTIQLVNIANGSSKTWRFWLGINLRCSLRQANLSGCYTLVSSSRIAPWRQILRSGR